MRLRELRRDHTTWHISVLNGPNLLREIGPAGDFDAALEEWANDLGVRVTTFRSNHDGELLERVHRSMAVADGYLVNPGGLTGIGESLRHVLKETRRPIVEVHGDNRPLTAGSVFAPSVTSIFSGLQRFGHLGALVALVLALDDPEFLHPDGTSSINRSHGTPRSLYE